LKARVTPRPNRNAVVFPSRWLDQRITSADALLHRFLEREANELHALRKANIIGDTRRLLRTSLMAGNCTINDMSTAAFFPDGVVLPQAIACGSFDYCYAFTAESQ
jgi:hypothetical protein